MSSTTKLVCNKFGGIRQHNAVFNSELITAEDMQNVEFYATSMGGVGIRTQKGNKKFLKFDNEKIIGFFPCVQNQKDILYIHTETDKVGKLYAFDFQANVKILVTDKLELKGISNGISITQGWSDLFVFTNGSDFFNVELKYDEQNSVFAKITNMAICKDVEERAVSGICLANFDGRLWVANGEILWHSVQGNINDFHTLEADVVTTAGYIEFTKKITAIANYLGSLAVFHEDSSELVTVDSSSKFAKGDESPGGCASFNSLIFHGTELYFYDNTKKGIYSFKQVVNGDKTLSDNLAIDIQETLAKIPKEDLDKIRTLSVIVEDHNEIWFLLPLKDDKYSTILIYDYLRGEWLKRKCQKINCFGIYEYNLYSGGNNGNLYLEYTSDSFDGEYIRHYYYCSPLTLGELTTLKVLKFPPRVSLDLPYDNNFYVSYIKNFDSLKAPKTKHIKVKYKNIMVWDESEWDSEAWLMSGANCISKFPNATFKSLEIRIYTTDFEQNFAIRNMELSKIKVKQV